MQFASNQNTHGRRSRRATRGAPGLDVAAHAMRARARQEQLLDEALEETFPASDPVAVMRLT